MLLTLLTKHKSFPEKKLYYEPKCRYGAYLQKMHLSLVCSHGDGKEKKKKPRPLDYRIRLKSETVISRPS